MLGKHPVFGEINRIREVQSAGPVELMRRSRNLRAAIYRLRAQISGGSRPDLEAGRQELLQVKERELAEVDRMLENYKKAYERRVG